MERVIVVGAGAIGLLSAFMLAQQAVEVIVLEAGASGAQSSWAGGGIVSPLYPWRYSAPVTALAHWSQDYYPELAERLSAQSGIDPEVYVTGLYWLDLADQTQAIEWAKASARPFALMAGSEVKARLPSLAEGFSQALYMPQVANVRNPRLVKALRAALVQMDNVTLHERCPVSGFVQDNGRVSGVLTEQGRYSADKVVLAAGAWSGELLKGLGLALPVEPVKGQMILYKCASDFLTSMVLADGRYAIPRRDGHILVGSTLEHEGFDKTPTASALESLKASAVRLLPELAHAGVVGHWAGLRPGSPDGIPFIGELSTHPGLWLNCGHYRNGLVLAPASCELLKNLMLGQAPIVDPAPYLPASRLR